MSYNCPASSGRWSTFAQTRTLPAHERAGPRPRIRNILSSVMICFGIPSSQTKRGSRERPLSLGHHAQLTTVGLTRPQLRKHIRCVDSCGPTLATARNVTPEAPVATRDDTAGATAGKHRVTAQQHCLSGTRRGSCPVSPFENAVQMRMKRDAVTQ